MMTMHILIPPTEWPCFRHANVERADKALMCLTVRGAAVCACGRYHLCDPLAVACRAACECECHTTEGGDE